MPRAERDLAGIYASTESEHSNSARQWFNELESAILTLETNPNRCPPTPENTKLRHMLCGKKPHIYRVIYRIIEHKHRVDILHVRQGAREYFKSEDVEVTAAFPLKEGPQ